jgi:hypothetical protein
VKHITFLLCVLLPNCSYYTYRDPDYWKNSIYCIGKICCERVSKEFSVCGSASENEGIIYIRVYPQ